MATVTTVYSLSAVSVGSSELSLVSGTTTLQTVTSEPGMYVAFVDGIGSALAKGDRFMLRFYDAVLSGGTKRLLAEFPIEHAQSQVFNSIAFPLAHGWDITLQKEAGTDRNMIAGIRRIGPA